MIYAIGDIHGQIEQLERALALVEADGGKDARIVFVGDYTDRGLNSRAVIAHQTGLFAQLAPIGAIHGDPRPRHRSHRGQSGRSNSALFVGQVVLKNGRHGGSYGPNDSTRP
ncbi:MAG: hypothetical protein EBT13_08375 [Rhodobacteraceae bacterium]|nr:hypothetical protein [Paracoccaceae bacterium]